MTKTEFYDWKSNPVTKEVFRQFQARAEMLREVLGDSAGEDPQVDRWRVGVIQGYKDLLNIEFEEETPTND